MRCFTQRVRVPIPAELLTRARGFAIQVTPSIGSPGQGYQDTRQVNLSKIQHDHFVGKVGEEAARLVFEQQGDRVEGPDYQIYLGKQKSWTSDLLVNGVALAVKTQTTALANTFGLSWTFQAGSVRRDPILSHPGSWVCFVEFDEVQSRCTVYPPYQIQELRFEEPRLVRLRGSKKVVYARALPTL